MLFNNKYNHLKVSLYIISTNRVNKYSTESKFVPVPTGLVGVYSPEDITLQCP